MDVRPHPTYSVKNTMADLMKDALKDEFRFFANYPLGEEGTFAAVIEAQNKLTDKDDKKQAVVTAMRELQRPFAIRRAMTTTTASVGRRAGSRTRPQ